MNVIDLVLILRCRKVLIMLVVLGVIMSLHIWGDSGSCVNPNRYLDVYQQYINAPRQISDDNIKHFVYFTGDREAIHDHPFLSIDRFSGAQIMYSWRQLETKDRFYDFSIINEDFDYLKAHGKQLFIQLQDASFYTANIPVPDYLLTDEYNGGAIYQRTDNGKPEGWVAKRWNKKVQNRFALLLKASGSINCFFVFTPSSLRLRRVFAM